MRVQQDPRNKILRRLAMAVASGIAAPFTLLADVGEWNAEHPDDTISWDEARAMAKEIYAGT